MGQGKNGDWREDQGKDGGQGRDGICRARVPWSWEEPVWSKSGVELCPAPEMCLESGRSEYHSLPAPACMLPPPPTFAPIRRGHIVAARLNFPSPYKVMSNGTWNPSSCK